MYTDRISDMIAHFIGLFETEIDEARLRTRYVEGKGLHDDAALPGPDDAQNTDQSYDTSLLDYDPGVRYRSGYLDFGHARTHQALSFEDALRRLHDIASRDLTAPHYRLPGHGGGYEEQPQLVLYQGPGSVIAHVSQFTLLQDDDYLNMTDGPNTMRDTTFATERTMEFYADTVRMTPFESFHRTDTYEGLQAVAKTLHDYIEEARENDVTSLGTGTTQDFVLADHSISGTYVNGVSVSALPDVDDYMPDRGIAKPPEDPQESDVPLESHGGAGNSLEVEAGANVVANIVSVVNTGVMSPVMAVMGDYHQIDAITQSYIYSDRDEIGSSFAREDHAATVANNIASFQRSVFGEGTKGGDTDSSTEATIFPTAWRVSYVEGDVSFVHWVEQYHFVTDNDTMTVTTSGADVSVLTGGNGAVNLASFLGIGMQYDLVIVGGHVLDMNMISQTAVLYDNDWVRALNGASSGATVQSGGNLIWNEASIHNVGANDRFDTMPDYMMEAAKAINERDPHMPDGLSTDPNFAGYAGLNVLYITGNLYDVTYIKQVSVLGDSDDVTQAVAKVLANNENATVHIDTGSNAVVNVAQITDYDSFGGSTYVAGHLYSDAVLIQGGLVENDTSQPHPAPLANEIIAFLHDDHPVDDHADAVFNSGHDLSWSQAHPVDVMQTAVA
ncbi:hypothetical protein [Rhizobium sp. Leaf262]|uniref:hypothetical protein n=1 Tax=Rhizobium sp. Leaf262 TaxID=1736312 RepID=UPI000713A6EC|nr:hypothetical protein [Rhizobium sp. Leaf262]KQO77613.1 hypothetical protein ASF29_06075 [Rhizobium sp. Leaf262]